ncbi:hypothetical protein AGMMS49574_05320 [Bacteroidia bacterium]|nr:hypothetical protein AGMMS49574_05320 [Bacteroidia bacterium]
MDDGKEPFFNSDVCFSKVFLRSQGVYDAFEGHTFYLQSIFNELYSLLDEDEECTVDMLQKAVKRKIKSFEAIYQDTLILLSQRQKEVLCAIAKARKATNINSIEFVNKYGLNSPSSVQSAVKHLIEKELIVVDNNVYQVYDRFFGMWLSTVFGNGYKLFN